MKFIIALMVLFFTNISYSDVKLSWGKGKLNIVDLSNDESLAAELKVLQTELLIDNELADSILFSSENNMVLPFDSKTSNLVQLKKSIKFKIEKFSPKATVAAKTGNKSQDQNSEKDDDDSQVEVVNNKGFVTVNKGEEFVVEQDDLVDVLVLMGGKAIIKGEVKKLILMKGQVTVSPTGKIVEKITELAGTIEVDQGGYVTENKTGILDNINFSGNVINNFTDISGLTTKIVFAVFRVIQVLFLFWLGFKLTPYINENLFDKKYQWPYEGFIGLVHLCLAPFATFMLAITGLGLAIVPIYVALAYILGLLGYGLICAIVGKKLLNKMDSQATVRSKYIYFFVGLLIFELLMLTPIFGNILLLVLMVLSLGFMTNFFLKKNRTTVQTGKFVV